MSYIESTRHALEEITEIHPVLHVGAWGMPKKKGGKAVGLRRVGYQNNMAHQIN